MIVRRQFLKRASIITLGAVVPHLALALPAGLVRLIAPTGAGSPPDILARIVANGLSEAETWTTVVEDKPGAASTLGAAEVLKQPADDHTLFLAMPPVAAAPGLIPDSKISFETDFVPIVQIGTGYSVLVVSPDVPAHSVSELVAYLKKEPGQHTFSSGGFGTPAHLLGELSKLETGVQATHVPYPNGLPRAIDDLMSGVNTYQFISLPPVLELIRTGKLRALAVMSSKRLAVLTDVPTIGEAGYPKLESTDWSGILVKSRTAPATVAQLNETINKVLQIETVRDSLPKLGVDVSGGTPEKFGALLHAETIRWTAVIKNAGIKIG